MQVSLVDDEGKEMVVSDWVELLRTTADVFASPEIFTSFLLAEGANQSEQYLFQQVNEDDSMNGKFKYSINFNAFTEEAMADPGESYALSKDRKVYTLSTYNDEGRDWRYSEEWTNKITNFNPERWVWEDGVKEQVIASLTEAGYIEEGNYSTIQQENVDNYLVSFVGKYFLYSPNVDAVESLNMSDENFIALLKDYDSIVLIDDHYTFQALTKKYWE